MKPETRVQNTTISLIILLGLLGGFIISFCTTWGPWAKSDSVEYLEAGLNMAAGHGLVLVEATGAIIPLTIRPPFYSILLGIAGLGGIDLLDAARVIDVVLFITLILSLGFSISYFSSQPLLSIVASLFIVTSPIFIIIYTGVMSEPIFFSFGILGIFLLIGYLQEGHSLLLILSAVLVGLAWLARYAGIAFIATGLLSIVLFSHRSFKKRMGAVATYIFFSSALFLLWAYTISHAGGSPGEYEFEFNNLWGRLAPARVALANTTWEWLSFEALFPPVDYRTKRSILIGIAILFFALSMYTIRKVKKNSQYQFLHNQCFQVATIFTLFTIIYTSFIAVTFLFVEEPRPAVTSRIFSPILIGALISGLSFSNFAVETLILRKLLLAIPAGIVLFITASNIGQSLELIADLHENGLGYTSRQWRGSDVISAMYELPDDVPLISNDFAAIKFFTGRSAFGILELEDHIRLDVFHAFGEDVSDEVQKIFREEGAALVLFNRTLWKFQEIYSWNTAARWAALIEGLYPYHEGLDGAIYFYQIPKP